jgi:hypothetical protein
VDQRHLRNSSSESTDKMPIVANELTLAESMQNRTQKAQVFFMSSHLLTCEHQEVCKRKCGNVHINHKGLKQENYSPAMLLDLGPRSNNINIIMLSLIPGIIGYILTS